MLDAAVPVACIHEPTPGLRQGLIKLALNQTIEVASLPLGAVAEAVTRLHQRTGRLIDQQPVVGMERARPSKGRVGRTQLDAASLMIKTTGGNIDRSLPDFPTDAKRVGTADSVDHDDEFPFLV